MHRSLAWRGPAVSVELIVLCSRYEMDGEGNTTITKHIGRQHSYSNSKCEKNMQQKDVMMPILCILDLTCIENLKILTQRFEGLTPIG